MPDLNDISNEPGYDAETTRASKSTIFTFIATFVVCLFYFANTAGLISGAVFVVVGMFAASIIISAPMFVLKKKFPAASIVFSRFSGNYFRNGSGVFLLLYKSIRFRHNCFIKRCETSSCTSMQRGRS